MKKTILVIALLLFASLSYAQPKYGVRAAVNASNLDFEPDADFVNQHRNGFAFAGFVEFGLSEKSSLMTELQWSAEGAKDEDLRANYIQMPLQLRYGLTNDLSIGAGPQFSLKTWGDKDGFATFAFSALAGIEYMITDELFVDLRYSYGFTNILDEDLTTAEAKNTNIQIGFGIKI